jgi:serine/threonine protein kinase
MGEVYRATDTNRGRDVTIKVLPEAFAQDAERVARFEREAKTLASLNHPNIASIYGFEKGRLLPSPLTRLRRPGKPDTTYSPPRRCRQRSASGTSGHGQLLQVRRSRDDGRIEREVPLEALTRHALDFQIADRKRFALQSQP